MKNLISTFIIASGLLMVTQSCDAQKVIVNREVETTSDGKMLLGTQTVSQFEKAPYDTWYNDGKAEYQMKEDVIEELKKEKFKTYTIKVFLGTWCEDSHREFPRFMKIVEATDFPVEKLTLIAVNRKKESPDGEEATENIQRVPTFIVSKYGKEIGRIIEFPTSGYLEKDLLEIIRKDTNSIKDIFK